MASGSSFWTSPIASATSGRIASLIGWPRVRNTSLIVSLRVENRPVVVLLWAAIMPANLPPSEVMRDERLLDGREADLAGLDQLLHLGIRHAELLRQFPDDRDAAAGELVDVLGEQPPLDPRLAVEFGDLVDRRLDARRDVADAPQGLGHGVGALTEGDQLAAGVGQFRELERRLGTELRAGGRGFPRPWRRHRSGW